MNRWKSMRAPLAILGDTMERAPVSWTSLDTDVASVDPYGRVTALDTGSARTTPADPPRAAAAGLPLTALRPSRDGHRSGRSARRR